MNVYEARRAESQHELYNILSELWDAANAIGDTGGAYTVTLEPEMVKRIKDALGIRE